MNLGKLPIVLIRELSKSYKRGSQSIPVLKDISIEVETGEFLSLMGPSGSGKSTLMHLLGLLDRPDSGSFLLGGKDVTGLSDDDLAAALGL